MPCGSAPSLQTSERKSRLDVKRLQLMGEILCQSTKTNQRLLTWITTFIFCYLLANFLFILHFTMSDDESSQVIPWDPQGSVVSSSSSSISQTTCANTNTNGGASTPASQTSNVPPLPIIINQQRHLSNSNSVSNANISGNTMSPRSRRSSILDVGGPNSISNFASSFKRSANFGSLNGSTLSHGSKHMVLSQSGSPILHPVAMSPSYDNSMTPPHNLNPTQQHQHQENLYPTIVGDSNHSSFTMSPQRSNSLPETQPLINNNSNNNNSNNSNSESDSVLYASINDNRSSTPSDDLKPSDPFHSSKSTVAQTILNSINVLIGIGVLSLPLGFRLSGLVFGLISLVFAAMTTRYSAVLLGRILKRYDGLMSYNDIGKFVFGSSLSYVIFGMFATDLFGASLTMVILFSDSFNTIFQDIPDSAFKFIVCMITFFLNFLPLNILSICSFAGILCTSITVLSIFIAGFVKQTQPGSLLSPMEINLWPESALDLFFSAGLFLAPWGGHAVFPELFRDMRHPHKYDHCMDVTFTFSYAIDTFTAVMGFLMFGLAVEDEITRNILMTPGYPAWVGKIIIVLMGLLPISKLPLVSRPLITFFDSMLINEEDPQGLVTFKRIFSRLVWSLILFGSTLVFTSFGKIMAILGSLICFTICISIPVIFYLSVFNNELPGVKKIQLYGILLVSVTLTVCGTVAGIIH